MDTRRVKSPTALAREAAIICSTPILISIVKSLKRACSYKSSVVCCYL